VRVLAEEDLCCLCGRPVDKDLPAGLPGSPEVHELLAVSLGGSPTTRENLRLTHRDCNQRAGNGQKSAKNAKNSGNLPLPRSRMW
jgi:5-methylcytosine-specific restriction endonuclease McrA